jgi:hypothetical protein
MKHLEFEKLSGIYFRSSQGDIDPGNGVLTTTVQWEETYGFSASIDALINTLKCSETIDPGCTKNDIRCRFIINEGFSSEIRLPECFFNELRNLIQENMQ